MTPDVPIPDVETIRKEKKPFAHFQWNYGWGHWEQVIEEAAGHDGVFAAYLAPCDHDNKLERLNAEITRLLANAKQDAGYLAAYHYWCQQHGCAPSSSDLISARAALAEQKSTQEK